MDFKDDPDAMLHMKDDEVEELGVKPNLIQKTKMRKALKTIRDAGKNIYAE